MAIPVSRIDSLRAGKNGYTLVLRLADEVVSVVCDYVNRLQATDETAQLLLGNHLPQATYSRSDRSPLFNYQTNLHCLRTRCFIYIIMFFVASVQ